MASQAAEKLDLESNLSSKDAQEYKNKLVLIFFVRRNYDVSSNCLKLQ